MLADRLRILEPDSHDNPGPDWLGPVLRQFRTDLLDPGYPCNFGRAALKHRELFITWVARGEPATLPADLAAFLDIAGRDPARRRPLVAFVQPPPRRGTEDEYDDRFWAILQYLHDHDDRPWPADVPRSPDEPGWQFCFHGVSIFVFALVPTNTLRRSRTTGEALAVVFMPRTVFLGVEVGTPAGDVARDGIRRRLRAWDRIAPHPSMGERDDLSDDEWRQYFLTDTNDEVRARCPFVPGPVVPGRAVAGPSGGLPADRTSSP